ncbi:N-acetylneuraminate synthase family protein [Candidatus Pelagibacter sp.]|nr:N-acetylneuraminate synthase family protein [Candidatus Pelagibacter sp.]
MISINKTKISEKHTPYIIVEACVNHQGDFSIAKKMIFYAKKLGAQCIKFQHHIVDEEMIRDVPMSSNFKEPLDQVIEKTNFTLTQHIKLKKYCDDLNINYLCTPFSIKAAEELNKIGVKAFKTGSGELTNLPFIDYLAKIGKPVILSTGMSYPNEIEESVKILKKYKTPFSIMHCISAYPCPYEIMNLDNIIELKKKYKVPIGLSDHTPSIYNALGAISLGASLIEKHFTFDKNLQGPDHKSSINLPELKMLVQGCRANFLSRGSKKIIFRQEKEIVAWARESVVSSKNIKKNEKINIKNICTKRPTAKKGQIPASDFFNILKKKFKTKKFIKQNTILKYSDLI